MSRKENTPRSDHREGGRGTNQRDTKNESSSFENGGWENAEMQAGWPQVPEEQRDVEPTVAQALIEGEPRVHQIGVVTLNGEEIPVYQKRSSQVVWAWDAARGENRFIPLAEFLQPWLSRGPIEIRLHAQDLASTSMKEAEHRHKFDEDGDGLAGARKGKTTRPADRRDEGDQTRRDKKKSRPWSWF